MGRHELEFRHTPPQLLSAMPCCPSKAKVPQAQLVNPTKGNSSFVEDAKEVTLKAVHLIVNPKSGGKKGLKIMTQVLPVLKASGIEVHQVHTEYAGHAEVLARTINLADALL